MFLRRSLAQYNYIHFVGTFWGLAPPPPNTKKLATLVTTHTFPLGAPHWRTGGEGGGLQLGTLALQNKIQSLLI